MTISPNFPPMRLGQYRHRVQNGQVLGTEIGANYRSTTESTQSTREGTCLVSRPWRDELAIVMIKHVALSTGSKARSTDTQGTHNNTTRTTTRRLTTQTARRGVAHIHSAREIDRQVDRHKGKAQAFIDNMHRWIMYQVNKRARNEKKGLPTSRVVPVSFKARPCCEEGGGPLQLV
jgi:hypothetical protein